MAVAQNTYCITQTYFANIFHPLRLLSVVIFVILLYNVLLFNVITLIWSHYDYVIFKEIV